eukprot:m51a1_g1169 hypothetical protein (1249) ;mRNA; f:366881-373551
MTDDDPASSCEAPSEMAGSVSLAASTRSFLEDVPLATSSDFMAPEDYTKMAPKSLSPVLRPTFRGVPLLDRPTGASAFVRSHKRKMSQCSEPLSSAPGAASAAASSASATAAPVLSSRQAPDSDHTTVVASDEELARQLLQEDLYEQRMTAGGIHTFVDENGEIQYYVMGEDPEGSSEHIEIDVNPQALERLTIIETDHLTLGISRETLLLLFDRNETLLELAAFCVLDYFSGFGYFWLFLIIASAQYNLIRAPHPDSAIRALDDDSFFASGTRAFYFCLRVELWGVVIHEEKLVSSCFSTILTMFKFMPLLYVFGLMPHIDTFLFCVVEQINIFVFGGSGAPNIPGVTFEFCRNVFVCSIVCAAAINAPNDKFVKAVWIALSVSLSYLNSRIVNNPLALWDTFANLNINLAFWRTRRSLIPNEETHETLSTYPAQRIVRDITCTFGIFALVFFIQLSTVAGFINNKVPEFLNVVALLIGLVFDVVLPRIRHAFPFSLFQAPLLGNENDAETGDPLPMWFEKLLMWFRFAQTAILYPFIFIGYLSNDLDKIIITCGINWGVVVASLCGLRAFRSTFTDVSRNHLFIIFTLSFFTWDIKSRAECFTLDYFLGSIIMLKLDEFITKVNYIYVYIAPWNLSWGSTVHALIEPLALPHTALLFVQLCWSTLTSAPIHPVLGSVWFFTSHPRPMKYWERNRIIEMDDSTNMRLQTSLSCEYVSPNADSVFYHHLMIALQKCINRDREAGRLGSVHTGDVFLLTNDVLTAMLSIVSMGNGFTTFQMRGLELQGTFCQEQELAAVHRNAYNLDRNCVCPRSIMNLPACLTLRDGMGSRWNAWKVVNTAYVVESYNVSLIPATSMFNLFSLRQILIRMYVSSVIYYLLESPSLESWVRLPEIASEIDMIDESHIDRDTVFCKQIDPDYDASLNGVTFEHFMREYGAWIAFCAQRRDLHGPCTVVTSSTGRSFADPLTRLCFALSLLARRVLVLNRTCVFNTNLFLQRFHSLLGGDIRITAPQDEWVLSDISILDTVIARAIKISFRLQQDHFAAEDHADPADLHAAIGRYETTVLICREEDPQWRNAITGDAPMRQLMSLRKKHVTVEGADQYYVVRLTLRNNTYSLVRINRECVRGLWASQQQELVYFGNTNPERGSIQQLSTVLRNIINQACDPPVGYPIFVSPLATHCNSSRLHLGGRVCIVVSIRDASGFIVARAATEPLMLCSKTGSGRKAPAAAASCCTASPAGALKWVE